jgi:V8-like Glu-specific endopeptidase
MVAGPRRTRGRCRGWSTVVLAATVALLGACTTAGRAPFRVPPGTNAKPPGTPTAKPFGGSPSVGVLFPPGSLAHTCTASVVDSSVGDLLITAAHCISGTGYGYVFVPGYHGGIEPLGSWTVVKAYGAPDWIARQAPQADFAFLVVAPQLVDGHVEQVQDVTGANELRTAPTPGDQVTVPAYGLGRNDDPITCTTRVYFDATFPAFDCDPYANGTSGAPWLLRGNRGWYVVGVIGGLHQGGCHPWTSYSAAFGAVTSRTYSSATGGATASTFPSAGSDGCSAGP